jgi:hypothetical protein
MTRLSQFSLILLQILSYRSSFASTETSEIPTKVRDLESYGINQNIVLRAFADEIQLSLDEIVRFKMAPCDKLDYVLMYHALRFVGANPNRFGMSLEESKIPKKLPPLYRQGQNSKNLVHTMLK